MKKIAVGKLEKSHHDNSGRRVRFGLFVPVSRIPIQTRGKKADDLEGLAIPARRFDEPKIE